MGGVALVAPGGLLLALPLAYWLLTRFILARGRPGEARRWVALRLRPLQGAALAWTLLAVPLLLVLSWALSAVYTGLVPVPPDSFHPFASLDDTPLQRLSIVVMAVSIAPLLEELVFRGLLQYRLERRHGPVRGIALASLLFAVIHLIPWILPLHFALGAFFGWMVYATRSIWAGVILHTANNAAAVLSLREPAPPTLGPTVWAAGPTPEWWTALAVLGLATLAAVWLGRRAREAGHGPAIDAAAHPGALAPQP